MRRTGLALLLAALVAAGGCTSEQAPSGTALPGTRPGYLLPATSDRDPLPALAAYPTVGEDGGEASLEDLRGQVGVVNFWASWCGPCRDEQPDLNEAYEELEDEQVAFLGVNFRQDSQANAEAHQVEFGVPYPSIYDPSVAVAAALGVTKIPATVILDPQGRVAATLPGTTTTEEVVAIAERLAQEAA